jgi:hypothetical protein
MSSISGKEIGVHSIPQGRIYVVLAVVLALSLNACGSEEQDGPLCLDDCELCTDQGCPDDRCGLLFILSKDCQGKVEVAEVTVDQCLEDQVLTPGTSILACKTLKDGESGTVTARSEDWVWVEDVTCTNQHKGTLIPVAFYCISQSNE